MHLANPSGVDRGLRREQLDALAALNEHRAQVTGDPEIEARVAQYEMAFRMQARSRASPISPMTPVTFDLYGEDARRPGTCAANCLMARRMMERGVRFVQLFHRVDQRTDLVPHLSAQCRDTDRAARPS